MSTSLFLVGWMLTRLVLINDRPLGTPTLLAVAALQVAVSLVAFGLTPVSAGAALVALLLLVGHERWFSNQLLASRLGSTVIMFALLLTADAVGAVRGEALLISGARWHDLLWLAVGFLLVANEVNFAIRLLFRVFDLEPRRGHGADADPGNLDEREYNAGRVIGILERWLIYSVLAVSNEYAVIALIVAAKGFARFRQLDEREFAEYVLVGTLASTLFTIWVAKGIRLVLAA